MPRINRNNMESEYFHVIVQGINKEKIYYKDYYKKVYLKYIFEESRKLNIKILIYTVMTNHAHFIIYSKSIENLSKMMGIVNSKFAKFYNRNENRVGYVFRDRFKSIQIKNYKQLYRTIAYIHYNPVKAKIVENLDEYEYSSYKNYINNKVNKENVMILFETNDYKEIFQEIHKKYNFKSSSNIIEIKEDYNEVINEYLNKNKIQTLKLVTKENNLLIELIKELRERCKLKDIEISKILGIGKNRIYIIMNKK